QRHMQGYTASQRVSAQGEALGGGGQHVLDAARERDGRLPAGRLAVPREIEGDRPVAFTVQEARYPVPGTAGAAEAVQQDDALRHEDHPMPRIENETTP